MDLCSSVFCDELELRVTIRQMIDQILYFVKMLYK